jgi:thiamine-phosphate pyrophosphorylase
MLVNYLKLCLITHTKKRPLSEYRAFILRAIQGGVTSVQLREKDDVSTIASYALALQAILKPLNIPLIINDDVAIAQTINADGVHIGQSDMSPMVARQILGPHKIIGWSIETLKELEIANQMADIDYVAASAVFPSKTKPNCKTIWGVEGLQTITQISRHPVIAIGGINKNNIGKVMASGACGAAVIGAIHDHFPRPQKAAADLIHAMTASVNKQDTPCSRR